MCFEVLLQFKYRKDLQSLRRKAFTSFDFFSRKFFIVLTVFKLVMTSLLLRTRTKETIFFITFH